METKNCWKNYSAKQIKELEVLNKDYRDFLDNCKTERECVNVIVNMVEKSGYVELSELIKNGTKIKKGDKIYSVNMNKGIFLFNIGEEPLERGMNILGAHLDSPRFDVKSNPLYEKDNLAYLDTHYYGGFKKYQWVATPMSLHGVVIKKDGTTIELAIGEDEDDPVFFFSDLLYHLAAEQLEKKAAKVIEGEAMDIIVGNRPLILKPKKGEEEVTVKDPVKALVLNILKEDYDMDEEDFLSAELEVVPAGKAREAGFDRSMILSYGQDDRACAFTSLYAMLSCKEVKHTSCTVLVDKEEIGSVGATGMTSNFFENVVAELVNLEGDYSELKVRRCLANSTMLSSDVTAGYDPTYYLSYEKKNSAFLSGGIALSKYSGIRGKRDSNDTNAEYLAYLRKIFDEENVVYQFAELGKVDAGGGGTIAYIMAKYGMNVIDAGVGVLNVHSQYEVTSKADIYELARGYIAFLNAPGF